MDRLYKELRLSMHDTRPEVASLPPEAFVRLPQVIALVGLKRASIYAKIAKGSFPAPHKLTAHASGWRIGDVRNWLANPRGWEALHRD